MGSTLLTLPFNGFFVVVFLLFLLLHLPLLSAFRGQKFCPKNHICGNLNISYPFYNRTNNWRCKGLELFRCQNGATTLTDIMDDQYIYGSGYEVQSIDYNKRTALVHDRRFNQYFYSDNERCNFLFNFSSMPPIFRYLLAEVISHNFTLRVCKSHHPLADNCTVEALPHVSAPASSPSATQSSKNFCKNVYLPLDVDISTFNESVSSISKLFSIGFRLHWKLPPVCNDCAKNGTKCVSNNDKNISCSDPNGWKGKMSRTKTIAIGIAGIVAGILLTSLIFFVIYKYKTGHSLGRKCNFSLKTDHEKGSIRLGVPIFSYAELEEATDNFSSVNEVGDGGYGTVYRGKLQDGRDVAIKRLYHSNNKHVERFMNEIEILTNIRHQNLVTLYGCTSYRSRELLLVYEFIPNGTVADHLHGNRRNVGSLPWPVRMSIAMETASALSYLHASDVIHRDVKTSNILLDNHFHVKVADFGLSRLFPTDASHVSTAPQGTPGYVDPEYYRCYQLTDKSDVYSFGVVLIELVSSKLAVDFTRHQDEIDLANMALNKIQNEALQDLVDPCLGFESDCSTRRIVTLVAELAFRCLQHEKELRPSMDEVFEILTAIAVDEECSLENEEEIETVTGYDAGLLKNTPPPTASHDSGEIDILVSQPSMPSSCE